MVGDLFFKQVTKSLSFEYTPYNGLSCIPACVSKGVKTLVSVKILVSKKTVVLRRYESETRKFCAIKRVDEGRITTMKDLESWRFQRLSLVIRSDEGLTLETSGFQIFYGGNSTFINLFDKTKFSCYN